MNWIVIPTIVIALILFVVGQRSVRRCQSRKGQLGLSALWLFLSIPGLLLTLYYLHWFDDAKWFYEFRSLPFTELSAAGAGLFAGALSELFRRSKLVSELFLLGILIVGIIAPHLKPVLAPVPSQQFGNCWKDDICIQSTPSSCGAASAATVFRALGFSLSEQAVARECYTYMGGTENWYIARAFRRRGCTVTYRSEHEFPDDLKTPAIAGVRIGGVGHYIAILETVDGIYVTGDPLAGREEVPVTDITKKFDFTGFFMEIKK